MKTCIVLGSNSDIAQGLMPYLEKEYRVIGWTRGNAPTWEKWDLVLCMIGSVAPVGVWHEVKRGEWLSGIESNLIRPFELMHYLWPNHNPDATVIFMAGSNPNMIMPGYSAYNTGKMALLKLVEQMDAETPDAKFIALGPGTILTKIHKATLDAGWDNPKLKKAMEEQKPADYARLYECIQTCIAMPKDIIGGRNICVSDPWDDIHWMRTVANWDDWYKLRRIDESTT